MKAKKLAILISALGLFAAICFAGGNAVFAAGKISLSSIQLQQGDTLFVKVEGATNAKNIIGIFGEKWFGFVPLFNGTPRRMTGWIGILGIDAKEKIGTRNIALSIPGAPLREQKIKILKKKFPTTELSVTQQLKEKGFTPQKIIASEVNENSVLREITGKFSRTPYFSEPFAYPLKTISVAGAFGNIRKNGNVSAQHLGVDLDAEENTEVYAANSGVVRLAQEFPSYGKTIIIDHGLGIFSLYLHLNKFKVSAGQQVGRGEVIALSGNTGYSLAPHLHFSIKISGASVDPLKFIDALSKIKTL